MDNFLKVFTFLWTTGLLSAVVLFVIKLLKAHTKNQNLLMFYTWAQQAVHWAEVNCYCGEDKKLEASNFIATRLRANKLLSHFSDEQIEAVIEWAVAEMKKGEVKS